MNNKSNEKIRYAVVGLGHIAQFAALPSFVNAASNSELTALVSGTPEKLEVLGERYGVEHTYSYEQYDECLERGVVDAVFIALPNTMHREYTVRAAEKGVHVLCEKPLEMTVEDCEAMIAACRDNGVKLMTAYRLHVEKMNLEVIDLVQSGRIGDPRYFNSLFSFQIKEGNYRTKKDLGGGALYDIGVYCINAVRNIFQAEPVEVMAMNGQGSEPRFDEIEEMTAAIMRFPEERLATFTSSFGAKETLQYEVVGTKGSIRVDPAYHYLMELSYTIQDEDGSKEERKFPIGDHFGAQFEYFSNCILNDQSVVPSGEEGLADVRIMEAIYQSAATKTAIQLEPFGKAERPHAGMHIEKPGIELPELVGLP